MENKDNNKMIAIITAVLIMIYLMVLILIKIFVPESKLGTLTIWGIVGIVFGLSFYFGFRFFNNRTKRLEEQENLQHKLPPPITFVECQNLIDKIFSSPDSSYVTYLKKPKRQSVESVEGSGGVVSQVYVHVAESKHLDDDGEVITYAIIINMHEPHLKRTILKNPHNKEIEQAINRSASFPAHAPNKETIIRDNPIMGISERIERETHSRVDDVLEKANQEDLVQK